MPTRCAAGNKTERNIADGFFAYPLVENVFANEPFAGARVERVQVDVPAFEPGARVVERPNARGAHENAAALAAGYKPKDAGGLGGAARNHNDVVNLADGGAARIQQGQPHHAEGINELADHTCEATPVVLGTPTELRTPLW